MSKKINILTDSSVWDKAKMIMRGQNLKKGCAPANANFNFDPGEYGNLVNHYDNYIQKNSFGEISGDHVKIQLANDERILLDTAYSIIAIDANFQANHDLIKLKSSGGILTSDGVALGVLKKAILQGLKSTNANEIDIELLTYKLSVGTVVRWKDITAMTPIEHEFFTMKHIIHLDNLISGHQYEITVAHKGSVRKLIFSDPKKCWCQ